jgi:hypothetical protein
MDEQTAKDYAEDYTSKLMIDMYEAMSGVDLNDPNAAGLISQAFVAIPGFKDDPAKAINAMNALRDYKKTEAGMLEDYATGELKRSQARKEGALADLYSQGKSPGWKNPAKPGTNRPVTNIQKFNALKGQLDIWSDQAQKAGDGMAKLKEKMADTKESNPELKSQEYIQYQNLYDEARREGQRIIDSIRTLQPLTESDPDGIYSAPNPQPAPGVKDIKRKKTQMERFEELTTGPDAVTNDEAYKTIAIELKNGLITK